VTTRVLILSSIYDFAVDLVLHRLRENNITYLRLNREQLADLRLSLDPATRTMNIRGLGIASSLGPDLESVWYRSPIFLRNTAGGKLSLGDQLARSQWSAFLRSMMIFEDARWMNHPGDIYKAEVKPYQLLVAAKCGFAIPETVVGNDVEEIQRRFPTQVAIKSIDTVYLREDADVLFTYTNIIPSERLSDLNLHQAPLIAQQPITPKTDIRVTVVGTSVFAYKILVNGEAALGDWRLHKREEIRYEPMVLAPNVEERCIELCSELKLSFGAIDLIDSDGKIIFIEINPTGEWAWLPGAEATAGAAIAAWLGAKEIK
jgi:hypothetical protein